MDTFCPTSVQQNSNWTIVGHPSVIQLSNVQLPYRTLDIGHSSEHANPQQENSMTPRPESEADYLQRTHHLYDFLEGNRAYALDVASCERKSP
jgi:hypothetical protein